MAWTSPFIIYRVNDTGTLDEVFHAEDLKKAKYWLTYIGKTGDVLCRTPAHQKLVHAKTPEYFQHKELSGQPSSEKEKWSEFAKKKNFSGVFPEDQRTVENEEIPT